MHGDVAKVSVQHSVVISILRYIAGRMLSQLARPPVWGMQCTWDHVRILPGYQMPGRIWVILILRAVSHKPMESKACSLTATQKTFGSSESIYFHVPLSPLVRLMWCALDFGLNLCWLWCSVKPLENRLFTSCLNPWILKCKMSFRGRAKGTALLL